MVKPLFVLHWILFLSIVALSWPASAQEFICARVKIEILQELTLERQAFEARMTINNGLPDVALDNLAVDVSFADRNGRVVRATSNPNDTGAKFFLRLQTGSTVPTTVPGGTSSKITWLIIPSKGAGGSSPQGELYSVGAKLTYRAAGEKQEVQVTPDTIFVKPLPDLALDYFLPAEVDGDDPDTENFVEIPVPFSLGVRVKNTGYGTAFKLKIESAQPRIIENKQGLLVNFHIDASEVNGLPATKSLLADFGDISPSHSGVARWIMTASLSGRFEDFVANYTHADELGGEVTSLLEQPRTHLILHDVLVDLPGRDSIRDFLAKDGDILRVYESENADTEVLDRSKVSGISGSGARYTLTTGPAFGFGFIKLPDPVGGLQNLRKATRADGKSIQPANAWQSKTWDRVAKHWNYFVSVFDYNNTAGNSYLLEFEPPPDPINRSPRFDPLNDWVLNVGNFLSIPITANDDDGDVLSYSMTSGPTNATLNPVTGLFRWRPNRLQAPSTNVIEFKVTDNGKPNRSDTTRMKVVVLPAERFEVVIGKTNVFGGESNSVPLILKSDVELTNLMFTLQFPAAQLTNLGLVSIAPEVFDYSIRQNASNQYTVQLTLDPLRVQSSVLTLARLGFVSLPLPHSAIAPLHMDQVAGQRQAGTVVTNAALRDGRVLIFVQEPLVELEGTTASQLTVYGKPGRTYAIDSSASLGTNGTWAETSWVAVSNRLQRVPLEGRLAAQQFFRAREFQTHPPVLTYRGAGPDGGSYSWLLLGASDRSYGVETSPVLKDETIWKRVGKLGESNSWYLVSLTNKPPVPAQFLRATLEKP